MVAVIAAGSLSAKNQRIENFYTNGISPDGTYIHGSDGAFFLIKNVVTEEEWNYDIDHNGGNGNCWTNDGMMVGNIDDYTPAIWRNGQWTPLALEDPTVTHILRGVTPNGKYICGTRGLPKPTGDVEDYLMSGPVLYERQEDGTYGEPIALPYPEKDITNRIPQYITANNISDDGRTIIGQIVDGNGFLIYPIAFFKEDDGSWTFNLVQQDVVNPQKISFPEFPGSGPIMPMAESFLSPEEKEAYDAAIEEWHEQGSDYESEPDPLDFLGEENLEAYLKAEEEYTKVHDAWQVLYVQWRNAYNRLLSTGHTFEFNDLSLSPNGTYYGANAKVDIETNNNGDIALIGKKAILKSNGVDTHDGNGDKKYIPFVFNLKDDTYKEYDTEFINGVELKVVTDDATIVGVNEPSPYPQAYLFLKGENKLTDLKSYISTISKETADWMAVNMTHDIDVYDPENDNYQLVEDYMITGIPYATPDLKTFVTTAYAIWTAEGSPYLTYVLTPDSPGAVKSVTSISDLVVKTDATGTIYISRPADIEIYDTAGVNVFKAKKITTANPSLDKGIYLIKVVSENGASVTSKIAL